MKNTIMATAVCGSTAALFLFVGLIGCSDSTKAEIMKYNDSEIRRLHNCYQLFIQRNGMSGPKDEAEFKEFLKSPGIASNLELIDMDASMVDDMFINDRDGKPFVIKYGINGYGPAIVFEAEGVDSVRMVAFSPPREISDAAEYDRLLNGESEGAIVVPGERNEVNEGN